MAEGRRAVDLVAASFPMEAGRRVDGIVRPVRARTGNGEKALVGRGLQGNPSAAAASCVESDEAGAERGAGSDSDASSEGGLHINN